MLYYLEHLIILKSVFQLPVNIFRYLEVTGC